MKLVEIAALVALFTAAATGATVQIRDGALSGSAEDGVNVFKNIPYAAAPVGALRWRPPQAVKAWQGLREAKQFGPACPQPPDVARGTINQSEDCLSLNVWAPEGGHHLPVMVWIHGGGFTQGTGANPRVNGATLAKRDVVVVTFNYRLGLLGFMAHPSLRVAGEDFANYGLMDQIAALSWVQANIAKFGGDPTNVTIFGESAGAMSVNALLSSPKARGLIAKAIAESGPSLMTCESLSDAVVDANRLAKSLHATTAAQLRAVKPEALLAAAGEQDVNPIIDGGIITEDPALAFAHGAIAKVPYLTGSNSNEAALLGDYSTDFITKPLAGELPTLRALYEQDGKLSDRDFAHRLFTDRSFAASAYGLAAYLAKTGAPAYVYQFDFLTELARRRGLTGVSHGGEIVFVFGFGRFTNLAPARDLAMSDMVQRYWTNFARSGDPNGAGLPLWPKLEGAHPATLIFRDNTEARADFRKAQIDSALRDFAAKAGVSPP